MSQSTPWRTLARMAAVCALAVPSAAQDGPPTRPGDIAGTAPLTPGDELATFTVPPEFEVRLVAAEPDIQKPMQLAFDFMGRLFVSGSNGYPLGPSAGVKPSDRVSVIELDPGSGAAARISTFAEGFDICSGLLPMPDGSVILGHAPDILRLADLNGDGMARREDGEWETLYSGFGREDVHELPNSFMRAPDGWIYALQGHLNDGEVTDKRGGKARIAHGCVFRFKPDGSRLEVFARGMSNPWGLALDHEGNMFGLDCESRPLWQIIRGGSYQGFLQAEDPLGVAPPILSHNHRASGFAGLVQVGAAAWPEEYRGDLYHGNPITHTINRNRLEKEGSTRMAREMPDLLASSDPWFRPVDVELGPDGALYVADWYNRIIAHVEVALDHPGRDKSRGRIWRIAPKSMTGKRAPSTDFSRMKVRTLAHELGDANGTRREMAAAELDRRIETEGNRPFDGWFGAWARMRRVFLNERAPAAQRSGALWLTARRGGVDPFLRRALADPAPEVRATALRLWMNRPALVPFDFCASCPLSPKVIESPDELMLKLLDDPSPLVAREAALALAEHPTPEVASALFRRLHAMGDADPMLGYALRLGLRRVLKEPALMERKAEWIAEAARDEAGLIDLLASTQAGASCGLLIEKLESRAVPPRLLEKVLSHLLREGSEEQVERVFVDPFREGGPSAGRLTEQEARAYITSMTQAGRGGLTESMERIAAALTGPTDPETRTVLLKAAARHRLAAMRPLALSVVSDAAASHTERQQAADALLVLDPAVARRVLGSVVADPEADQELRGMFARQLAAKSKTPAEQAMLMAALSNAPAGLMRRAIDGLLMSREGTQFLLGEVEARRISPMFINDHFIHLRVLAYRKPELDDRWRRLTENAPSYDGGMDELIEQRAGAYAARRTFDHARGREVFEKNCATCHQFGNMGRQRGPKLDGVASRGIERLMQDILAPNRNVDPAFSRTLVSLKDGDVAAGLIVESGANDILLADDQGQDRRIRLDEIESTRQLFTSLMPEGLGAQLPEEDFLDLTAFLTGAR